jgi:hypothetical protein
MKPFQLLLLLLFPFSILAQKSVDLDRYNFTVQFRALPKLRLDSSYRTYNVTVEGTKLMQSFLKELDPAGSVLLEGWKKLSEKGHVLIEVKLEDLLPENVSIKERVSVTKDRNGVVTSTKTFYRQEVIYTFAATARITDYKGMHIMDLVLADRATKQVFRSPEFPVKQIAEGYFMVNALATTNQLYRTSVNNAIHYLSDEISNNFGFSTVTVNDYMWVIDSRKHPQYAAHRAAFLKMNEYLFNLNAITPITGLKEKLQPVIDYFEQIKKIYNTTSKHDRKIRYASFFNLAVLYYYLDDPQAMMKEANGLMLNDFDSKMGAAFQQTALQLKNIFENSKIYTRHFSIDINTFKGPYENNTTAIK